MSTIMQHTAIEHVLGWLSSAVLLVTFVRQVHKQWQSRSVEGVSAWLYYGQALASAGFVAYSAMVHNAVFVVTNALGFVAALAGVVIFHRNKRRGDVRRRAYA
jgi:MtN3 and saliva related transmembrane protein